MNSVVRPSPRRRLFKLGSSADRVTTMLLESKYFYPSNHNGRAVGVVGEVVAKMVSD